MDQLASDLNNLAVEEQRKCHCVISGCTRRCYSNDECFCYAAFKYNVFSKKWEFNDVEPCYRCYIFSQNSKNEADHWYHKKYPCASLVPKFLCDFCANVINPKAYEGDSLG